MEDLQKEQNIHLVNGKIRHQQRTIVNINDINRVIIQHLLWHQYRVIPRG